MIAPEVAQIITNPVQHKALLDYLLTRLQFAEDRMRRFYGRWRATERRLQAYITCRDYDQLLRQQENNKGRSPKPVDIVVPYTYSAIHTMATYNLHTFAGRKPIFQLGANNAQTVDAAKHMEMKLDYDATHTRLVKSLWQMFWDTLTYGCGIVRTEFNTKQSKRSSMARPGLEGLMSQVVGDMPKAINLVTTYEGNDVYSVDPFMFFPDPRCSMSEVNRKGEFVFWRHRASVIEVKKREEKGLYINTALIEKTVRSSDGERHWNESERGLLSGGTPDPGSHMDWDRTGTMEAYTQLDECTIDLDAAALGLSQEPGIQRWYFCIANKNRIIAARLYDNEHEMHPVCVIEIDTLGSGFGQPGAADFISPLQDQMSWFINSHTHNVNSAVNNMFVVDPSMVELQDLKMGGDGRIIRLKRASYGQDVRAALSQLQIFDVTRQHVTDMQLIMHMADAMLGVNENMRSVQSSGGRKSATEVRTSAESGSTRMAARAILASSQGIGDMAEQMTYNNLQYLSPEFGARVLGQEFLNTGFLNPGLEHFDCYFPVHDGTLPLDKVALLDIWRQLFEAMLTDPQLRQGFDIMKIFVWIAKLGGAQNVEQFLIQPGVMAPGVLPMPDDQVLQEAAKGNLIPGSALGGVNPLEANPGNRMLQ